MKILIRCYFFSCFFFQAEDGIRDLTVTGVQTCALPIFRRGDPGLTTELPRELAHLRNRLGRDRLTEAGETARRVDRDAATDRGRAAAEQGLGLAARTQPDVLVPVELECRREVVDLGEAEVLGPES